MRVTSESKPTRDLRSAPPCGWELWHEPRQGCCKQQGISGGCNRSSPGIILQTRIVNVSRGGEFIKDNRLYDASEVVDLTQERADNTDVGSSPLALNASEDDCRVIASPSAGYLPGPLSLPAERNDLAVARALAGDCSQYTRRRKRGRSFRCPICLEDQLESFKGYSLSGCGHRFCIQCLESVVTQSTPSPATDSAATASDTEIPCPQPDCKIQLTWTDIGYIFRDDPHCFNQYAQTMTRSRLNKQAAADGGETHRCPAELCNYIFVVENDFSIKYECPVCTTAFCLQCRANNGKVGPPHIGMSCQ